MAEVNRNVTLVDLRVMNEPHSFTQFGNLMVCMVCGHVIQLNGWFMMKEEDLLETEL